MIVKTFQHNCVLTAGLLFAAQSACGHGQTDIELGVMTFNVWSTERTASGQTSIANAIHASGADIVGFQEFTLDPQDMLDALNGTWYYHDQPGSPSILSRYQITGTDPNGYGVKLELSPGYEAWFFNVHLTASPYGPYQLNGIPYGGFGTVDPEAPGAIDAVIQDQVNIRGPQINAALSSIQAAGALTGGTPVFFTGDFNEASHLDWTAAAEAAGTHVAEIPWPTSIEVADAGFKDSWREVHPDEVADPGNTWSPLVQTEFNDLGQVVPAPQDRIDFVYFAGSNVTALDSKTVGPTGGVLTEDIELLDFGSDHRAVVSTLRISGVPILALTTLTFDGLPHNPGNDIALNSGYGDNVSTTPNVSLVFSASNGSRWDPYTGGNWGSAAQLEWFSGAAEYDMTFTPDEGFGVLVSDFDLLDWETGSGHTVQWELLGGIGNGQTVLLTDSVTIGAGQTLQVTTGMTEAFEGELTLRLTHLTGSGVNLAIDNITFQQLVVPEPSSMVSLGLSVCMFFRRSRRR